MKCQICNSEKIVYAIVGFYCHDCDKLYLNEDMQNELTQELINRAKYRIENNES